MPIKSSAKRYIKRLNKREEKFLKNVRSFGNFSVKKDLSYLGDDNEAHLLDIIEPVLNHENGITLFYVHSYNKQNKEQSRIFTSWFANEGFKVVSTNYSSIDTSENIDIEIQVNDIVSAIKYIYEYRHENKIDFGKFCLMGNGIGAQICLLVDKLLKDTDIKINCLGLNSPVYDFISLLNRSKKYLNKKGLLEIFGKHYSDEDFINKNSPKFYVENGFKFSPIFSSTSYNDELGFQSFRLKKDTEKYGLDVTNYFEPNPKKEIAYIYNHFIFDDVGLKCNLAMASFFKKHCGVE